MSLTMTGIASKCQGAQALVAALRKMTLLKRSDALASRRMLHACGHLLASHQDRSPKLSKTRASMRLTVQTSQQYIKIDKRQQTRAVQMRTFSQALTAAAKPMTSGSTCVAGEAAKLQRLRSQTLHLGVVASD